MNANCNPCVSIVCCTHNRLDFVKTHFESLSKELDPRVELLYALDNCTDGTAEYLLQAIDGYQNVRLELHNGERGLFHCRNFGVTKARGRFIHFLDDDDSVESCFYSTVCDALELEENHDTDIFITRLRVSQPGRPTKEQEVISIDFLPSGVELNNHLHFRGDLFQAILNAKIYFNGANAIFNRKVLIQPGYRSNLKKSADWLLNLELALSGPIHIAYTHSAIANYFVHQTSMSLGSDKILWSAKAFDILYTLSNDHPEHKQSIARACASANFSAGYSVRHISRMRAFFFYLKSIRFGYGLRSYLAITKLLIPWK